MKKTILLGLTLMAMLLCLFVACSPDMALPEDKDGVAYVRFGGYTARSFTADYNIQQYENLYWFYTAEKTDGYGTYGATTALAPVNATRVDGTVTEVKKGLNGTIGPFSQGDWKFTLKAYSSLSSTDAKAPDESTLVYINDGEINVTLRGGETKSISANVKAFGETGFLSFRTLTDASVEGGTATETNVAFFKWANETSSTTLPCFTIEATRLGTNELYTLTTDETITTGNVTYIVLGEYDETNKGYPIQYFKTVSGAKVSADISLPVDYYSCKIYAYRPGETNEKNVIAMDKTFGFRIYGGATTVVKGDLTENPNSYATFDVPKIAIVSVIPKAEETTKITAYVAPKEVSTEAGEAGGGQTGGAGEAGGDSGTGGATTVASTNVDIPAGVLDSSGETTYSLEVSALSENKASNSFTVTASSSSAEGEEGSTGEAQIYGSISLSLNAIKGTTSTQVTEFKDASTQEPKAVTVSVFVGKGLEDITVKYIDEEGKVATDGQPTVEGDGLGYDATTGYITFRTTHFSTFVVASTKPAVVKNISQGKLYTTLEKAISSLDGTTELELVGTLAENTTIKLTEAINLVVDLKEKELKNITLEAGSGSLTLKNGSVSTATVKTGEVTFQNITSTNISLDKDYDGTITFDGGKLKAAAEGETAGYAFKVAENEMTSGKAPTYIFRNVEVTAGSLRGIKIVYAKSITVHNCTFNGTSLSASTSSNQPDYLTRALSALDIAVYSPNVDISIIGCTFNNITGAEAADAVATATDTAAAIKIKAQKVDSTAGSLGNVIIKNNTFTDCVRDVVVGKADTASQSFIYGTNPAIDVEGNVLSGWTITGNTSNKTSEVGNVGILVYTDSSGTKQSKKIGKVVGGCTVYDISTAYEAKIGNTLYFTLDDAVKSLKTTGNKTATIFVLQKEVTLGNLIDLLGNESDKKVTKANLDVLKDYTITFEGRDVASTTIKTRTESDASNQVRGANLIFKNMTVWIGYDEGTKTGSYSGQGFPYAGELTFANCDIEGLGSHWGKKNTFENCTFSVAKDWCISIQEFSQGWNATDHSTTFVFKNCTFSSGTGEFINVYLNCLKNTDETNTNLCLFGKAKFDITVEDCKFINTWTSGSGNSGRAAVFIKSRFADTKHSIYCDLTFKGTNTYKGTFGTSSFAPSDEQYKEAYEQNWRELFAVVEKSSGYAWTTTGNVTVKNGEEVIYSIWDGYVDTSWYSEDKTEFVLSNASELAGLASLVNEGNKLEDKTISLGSNIDLNNKTWTPIGLYKDENGNDKEKQFSGTFNGNGHTIKGLKIDCTTEKSSYRALFGYAGGTIKNFTVYGEISGIDVAGVVAALDKGGVVDNVTSYVDVSNNNANATQAKTGGIVLTIKDLNSQDAGWTISNCKNYGAISSNSTEATDSVGGILGWTSDSTGKIKIKNCENHGTVSASKQPAGGIVGGCRSIIIENCKNSGSISSSSAAGGIVACNDTNDLTIKNCSNSGSVTGASNQAGAIGGTIRGTLEDCTTTANIALVGTLGIGNNDNFISYSRETSITAPSIVYGNLSLKNVKTNSLNLAFVNRAGDLTVALNSSTIEAMTVTMEQNEGVSRLFLTKEGTSSIGSLKFTGSFDRQNINSHGNLYLFGNSVVSKENVSNELIFINRDTGSTDKDYGNASIYWVATGTKDSYTDSTTDVIQSVMTYNSSADTWAKSSN